VGNGELNSSIFRTLADDKSGALPYDADLADQRARYGDGLLRRAPEQLEKQQTYEHEAAARVEEARRVREAEKIKLQEAEVSQAVLCMAIGMLMGRPPVRQSLRRRRVRSRRSEDSRGRKQSSGRKR